MTTIDPSLAAFDRPDHLGGALQQGLPRPMNPKLTWGLILTFLLGGITGGIVPTLILPKRFRDFATAEQLQFWHLAEWLRLQTGDTEAAVATEAARRVSPGVSLRWASLAFVIVAIGIACTALPHNGPLSRRWFALTLPQLDLDDFKLPNRAWAFDQHGYNWHDDRSGGSGSEVRRDSPQFVPDGEGPSGQWFGVYHPGESDPGSAPRILIPNGNSGGSETSDEILAESRPQMISPDLVNAFALAMSGAALCWLIEINAHISRVRRFVGAFNKLSGRYGVGPVRPPGLHLGLRPLWLLGAAAMCALGGFWALPMMLAAGAHRRYIRGTSLRLRSDLARRQREVLFAQASGVAQSRHPPT